MPDIPRRARSFLFLFSSALSRYAFVSSLPRAFLFYLIAILALSPHTTCQTITIKPTALPATPEIAPTPPPPLFSPTLVEGGNGRAQLPKPTASPPSRPPPFREIHVPFNSSQITYTPFACNYTAGDVDPDGCEYAWRISNSTREVSISVDSGEGAELRSRDFIIPQMFFQFRASKLTLTTHPTSNATVRLTISSGNGSFDAVSTTLNTTLPFPNNGQGRSLTIVDIPFEDVSLLSLSVFPGQDVDPGSAEEKYVFGIQSFVVGVPVDAPIASVFPSFPTSSIYASQALPTSTHTTPPSPSDASPPSTSSSSPSSSSSSNRKRVSQALGLTLGLGLGLTAVAVVGFWGYRRRRQRQRQRDASRPSAGPSLSLSPAPSPRLRTRLGLKPYGDLEKRDQGPTEEVREVGKWGRRGSHTYSGRGRGRDISSAAFDRPTPDSTPRSDAYIETEKREDVETQSPSPNPSPRPGPGTRGLRWIWGRRRGASVSNPGFSPSPSPSASPLPYQPTPSFLPPRSPVTPTIPPPTFSFLPPSLSRQPPAPPPTPMSPTPILATAATTAAEALIGKPIVSRKGGAKSPVLVPSSSPLSATATPPPTFTIPPHTHTNTNAEATATGPYYPPTSHFVYPLPRAGGRRRSSLLVPEPPPQEPQKPLPVPPQSLTPLSRSRLSDSIRFSHPFLRGGQWVTSGASRSDGSSTRRVSDLPSSNPSPSPGYASVGHGSGVVGMLDVTMGYVGVERELDGQVQGGWDEDPAGRRVEGWFEDRDGRTRRRQSGWFDDVKKRFVGFGQRGR